MSNIYNKFITKDREVINAETIGSYAATNFDRITCGVKGIVVEFPDVDNNSRALDEEGAQSFADSGVAYARVCTSPWDWGSEGALRYADLVVDAIIEKYALSGVSIVAYGKGMGATAALLYAAKSRHSVSACAAEFPVVDMAKSLFLGESKIARTFVRTVYNYDMSLKDGLAKSSPIAKLDFMPDVPYYIVGGAEDALAIPEVLDGYVASLKKTAKDVTYTVLSETCHGPITPDEREKVVLFLKEKALAKPAVYEKKVCCHEKPVTATVGGGIKAGKAYEKYAAEDAEIFTFENLSFFTRNNLNYIKGDVKGIVMEFPGLGGSSCLGGLVNMGEYKTEFALDCAEKGILVMYMYCGPWSWGNKGVVRMADLVIDALIKHYKLPADIPVVSTGGSMGGIGGLNFTEGSRHNVVACMVACPCYDILGKYQSYDVNPNFPRTYLAAIYNYDMPLFDAIRSITPCENIASMPKIPYYIVCNVEDECFDDEGMQVYADDMTASGRPTTIKVLPNTKHGEFTDEERVSYRKFIQDAILGK